MDRVVERHAPGPDVTAWEIDELRGKTELTQRPCALAPHATSAGLERLLARSVSISASSQWTKRPGRFGTAKWSMPAGRMTRHQSPLSATPRQGSRSNSDPANASRTREPIPLIHPTMVVSDARVELSSLTPAGRPASA